MKKRPSWLFILLLVAVILFLAAIENDWIRFEDFSYDPEDSSYDDSQYLLAEEEAAFLEASFEKTNELALYSAPDDYLDSVTAYYQLPENVENIQSILRDETVLEVNFTSGITVCYSPEDPDTFSSYTGDDSVTLKTFEPYLQEELSKSYRPYGSPDDAAKTIDDAFDHFYFRSSDNYDEHYVTPDEFDYIRSNQMVLWVGHGNYSPTHGPYLITGERSSPNRLTYDSAFAKACQNGELLLSGDGRVAVTGNYIRNHCGSMENSVIILTSCEGGNGTRLVDAFLEKRAKAVFAYDKSVSKLYGYKMLRSVTGYLTQLHEETGDYYTLGQALEAARGDNGTVCPQTGAALKLFGGTPARNFRLATLQKETEPATTPPATTAPAAKPAPSTQAYSAYSKYLKNKDWMLYNFSDYAGEVSPSAYDSTWLGDYMLHDMDKDGTPELIIRSGMMATDTCYCFFTYRNGQVEHLGSLLLAGSFLGSPSQAGAVISEHHGGYGVDTYVKIVKGETIPRVVRIVDTQEYHYEASGYSDPKAGIWSAVSFYDTRDLSPLS